VAAWPEQAVRQAIEETLLNQSALTGASKHLHSQQQLPGQGAAAGQLPSPPGPQANGHRNLELVFVHDCRFASWPWPYSAAPAVDIRNFCAQGRAMKTGHMSPPTHKS
jgi:hypothetical protein